MGTLPEFCLTKAMCLIANQILVAAERERANKNIIEKLFISFIVSIVMKTKVEAAKILLI